MRVKKTAITTMNQGLIATFLNNSNMMFSYMVQNLNIDYVTIQVPISPTFKEHFFICYSQLFSIYS